MNSSFCLRLETALLLISTLVAGGAAPSMEIINAGIAGNGQLELTVGGQTDLHYVIQSSTNLTDWRALEAVVATNNVFNVPHPAWFLLNWQFYRAVTLP